MDTTTTIHIEEVAYTLISKKADRWGEFRFDLSKPGQEKPYSMSISSKLYKDSDIIGYGCSCPGWIYRRKCKHIRALAEHMSKQQQVAA